MRILIPVVTVIVMLFLAAPSPVMAASINRQGGLPIISCGVPFMESHSIDADGKSSIRFHGQCYYDAPQSAWNKHYIVNATWDGSQAREVVTIMGDNKSGTVVSTCPSNPWLSKVACQKKSLSGTAFSDYQITGATTYPLTANALSDVKKAALVAELAVKQKEAVCAEPVIFSPSPAKGKTYNAVPATVKVELRHSKQNPPKSLTVFWAPPTKQGEFPVSLTKQNMTLSNLQTSGGVTSGTLLAGKPGQWAVSIRTALPSYCNKGTEVIQGIHFTVNENSQNGIMIDKRLKNMNYKAIDGKIPATTPHPILQKQQLQQQKPM
ncbi:MAG: hypothetical protein AB9919_02475 [Geobacteraceae bacterium]